nr:MULTISPECIES: antitoxin Xre/MbcA/ParS toxin-binding domain-containing protein [unclassified Mycolicibacterium]
MWGKDAVRIWLESVNSLLGGARPIGVLRTDGAARALQALDAGAGSRTF